MIEVPIHGGGRASLLFFDLIIKSSLPLAHAYMHCCLKRKPCTESLGVPAAWTRNAPLYGLKLLILRLRRGYQDLNESLVLRQCDRQIYLCTYIASKWFASQQNQEIPKSWIPFQLWCPRVRVWRLEDTRHDAESGTSSKQSVHTL